jgi:PKHD-type hydroxylase
VLLEIKNLLAENEIQQLRQLSARVNFIDGRASNTGNATKQNLQVDPRDAAYAESVNIVAEALRRSREFADFALPRRFAPPMLSRYEPGMRYGPHADAAYLPLPAGSLRSDVSCTMFLSDPSAYEGGELVLHLGARALPLKFAAGSAVLYPSTTLHEVVPVRSGVRLVSLTFIESYIPDEHHRAMVYELGEISALEGDNMDWLSRTRLEVVRQNLLRMWSGS